MGKIQIKNYSFNKTAKTVTFTDYASIDLDSVLLITNVTSNIIIYRFNDSTKGGTVATNVLTLTYDTSSMSNTDKLQIFYDDVNYNDGSKADTEASSNTGTFSLIALFKRLLNTVLTGGSQKSQVVDGSGNVIGSTSNALDINIKSGNPSSVAITGTVTVDSELTTKDYDTGAGTDNVASVGILLPKSGGAVAGGTSTDPIRTDPTGTTTQPVSGSITANAGTNLNTSGLALETGGNLATIAGKDFATSAKQDIISTRTGDVTETAPATDTASSGINGRLQRIAQRITSLIALIPASLGQKTKANSLAVTLASDTDALPISHTDSVPATQNITAQDTASTTTTGANGQSIVTGTPTTNSTASFALSGYDSVKLQVTGTWTGTLISEISLDGGTTWYGTGVHQSGTSYTANNFTANFGGGLNVSGCTNFRIRSTAAWTGTATVKINATINPNSVYVANGINLQDATTQTQKLSISAAGAAKVDGSAVTQPVSGTVTANAGTGTFTVDSELTTKDYDSGAGTENIAVTGLVVPASGGSVNITGDAANGLDVDVTRLPALVAGTAIIGAVKTDQTTHGTTDLVAADVTKVAGTAVDVNSGNKSAGTQRVILATDQPELTNPLKIKPKLLEVAASVTASGAAFTQDVSDYKSYSIHISGTFVAVLIFQVSNDNTNWGSIPIRTSGNITTVSTVTTSAIGVYGGAIPTTKYFRVNLSSYTSGTVVITAEFSSLPHVPDVVTTMSELIIGGASAPVGSGNVTSNTPRFVLATDQPALTTPMPVRNAAGTTGGSTPYFLISAATTNATSVKGSAGTIYGIQVYNINAAVRYLKIYNKASAPTVGTDTPIKVIAIPGATTGAGSNVPIPSVGIALGTGIAFAITTGITTADTGAVAASEILVNIDYN
jgi:hypothetical protein